MRYSHEFKLECIEMYRQGMWPKTPDGIKTSNFHIMIRHWSKIEELNGPDALKHPNSNKVWTPEMTECSTYGFANTKNSVTMVL